jgi:hypothetical protein
LPDYSVQEENRQMQKMQLYQKLVIYTLLKYKWSILLIFSAALALGLAARYVQFKRSPYKYEAAVTLFYTPRPSEEVKPLSLNLVLGIFSRQKVYQQLIDEMQLNDEERAILKQALTVELLRDRNDMFMIKGKGKSEEYVRNLINTFAAVGIRNYEEYRNSELRNYLNARETRLRELHLVEKTQIEALHALHRKFEIVHPKEEMGMVKKVQGEQDAALSELNIKLTDARFRFAVAEKKYKAVSLPVIIHRNALQDYSIELRKRAREYEKAKLIFSERNPRYVESKTNYEVFLNEFNKFKKENGIGEFNESILSRLEGIVGEYALAETNLKQLEMSMKSLQAEIKFFAEKEKKLQHMIPEHDQVEHLLMTVRKNISLVVEELTRVRSNIAHVSNDIVINERVTSARAFTVYSPKIMILIFIAALFVSSLYAVIMVFCDIVYGKFSGIEEAGFFKDFIDTVGIIPDSNVDFSPEQRNVLTNEMFYNFILRLKDTRTIFSCSLDGSFLSSIMFDEQFTKAKRNTILVRLIRMTDVEKICAGMEKIGDFYYSDNGNSGVNYSERELNHKLEYLSGFSSGDGKGYGYGYGFAFFPVRNIAGLEPDEISTLYGIVKELKKHYQLIRISREKPFNASCLMVRQLHDICDATLLYIGKQKTPRRVLRKVMKLHDDDHKTYAIITGVTKMDKIISGDFIR